MKNNKSARNLLIVGIAVIGVCVALWLLNHREHVHKFSEWKVVREATCTQTGERERTCKCGEKETELIAATGHSFGEWTVTKEPDCENARRRCRL